MVALHLCGLSEEELGGAEGVVQGVMRGVFGEAIIGAEVIQPQAVDVVVIGGCGLQAQCDLHGVNEWQQAGALIDRVASVVEKALLNFGEVREDDAAAQALQQFGQAIR